MTADEQVRILMTQALGRVMSDATIQQVRAIGRALERGRSDYLDRVAWDPFDLPKGYVQLWFKSGFTCGISPEGDVSS